MRLNRRLEAITGLSTASFHSEALQVISHLDVSKLTVEQAVY